MVPIGVGEAEFFDGSESAVVIEIEVIGTWCDAINFGHIEEDDGCFTRDTHGCIGIDTMCHEIGVIFGDATQFAFCVGGSFIGVAATGEPFIGLTVHIDVIEEDLSDVVGDDIDNEFHIAFMEFIGEFTQGGEIPEVRIMFDKILSPIAVIGGESGVFFDIFDDGRNPESGDAEFLQVVEFIDNALPVAAVIPSECSGIDVIVVIDIAVIEPIDDELIDDLIAPIGDMRSDIDVFGVWLRRQRVGVDASRKSGKERGQEGDSNEISFHMKPHKAREQRGSLSGECAGRRTRRHRREKERILQTAAEESATTNETTRFGFFGSRCSSLRFRFFHWFRVGGLFDEA